MLCCSNCFESNYLVEHINFMSNDIGNCNLCPSQEVNLISPAKLSDLFLPVLDLYKKSDGDGRNLVDLLRDDWGLFLTKTNSFSIRLLKLVINDSKFSFSGFESRLVREKDLSSVWGKFRHELKHVNRFFPNSFPEKDKLSQLLSFLSIQTDRKLKVLYRARINEGAELLPLDMMGSPPEIIATAGRANPFGISYLYTASTEKTAISELRPHMHDQITVAHFQLTTSLKLIDLRSPKQTISPFQYSDEDLEMIHSKIGLLIRLGEELSKPVAKGSEHLEYLPSQYICEFIKSQNYNGVIYTSSLGDGDNYAIFESDLLHPIKAVGYQVGCVDVDFESNNKVIEALPLVLENFELLQGVVKWFNDSKGFGFIICDSLGLDVFVHYTAILSGGERATLKENDVVQFKAEEEEKGFRAFDVQLAS